MKPIKTYIHRILFRLGFCRKEAKEIFNSASNMTVEYFMCGRISRVLCLKTHLNFDISLNQYANYMRVYGFTRKNYHKFIRKYYPDLVKHLFYPPSCSWISVMYDYTKSQPMDSCIFHKIIESKNAFLKYLADKL